MTSRISHLARRASFVFAAFATALALGGLGSCAAPPATYATLEAVVIDAQRPARADELALVRVQRGTALLRTETHMPLQRGDLVMTGPRAYAVLHYATAEVLMHPDSQGRIGSLTEVIGTVFAKVRGAFAVETSFVRAGANGTAYLVQAAPDGATKVTVFDGTVTLSSRTGAWAPQRLAPGMTIALSAPSTAPQVQLASADDLKATHDWVDRIERLAPQRRSYGTAAAVGGVGVLLGAILVSRGGHSGSETPSTNTNSRDVHGAQPTTRK